LAYVERVATVLVCFGRREVSMAQNKAQLTERLLAAVRGLPEDKVAEVLDFAGYLQSKISQHRPSRGSAEAILQALEEVGPLQFDPGELEAILEDIERARDSDLDEHG
jgi:hypothetical protein